MGDLVRTINEFFGTEAKELTLWQVTLRAVVTYLATIVMVRFGHKRFMGRSTAFDIILGFILGSVVSRAINGQAPFIQTIVGAAALVLIHWLISWVAFHSETFSMLVKGRTHVIVLDGSVVAEEIATHHITRSDLEGALRQVVCSEDLANVKKAVLENSGQISFVLNDATRPGSGKARSGEIG